MYLRWIELRNPITTSLSELPGTGASPVARKATASGMWADLPGFNQADRRLGLSDSDRFTLSGAQEESPTVVSPYPSEIVFHIDMRLTEIPFVIGTRFFT